MGIHYEHFYHYPGKPGTHPNLYDSGKKVISWAASIEQKHYPRGFWKLNVVNSDNSISPTANPEMRWGVDDEGSLVLVDEEDTHRVLIFDQVIPTVDPNIRTLPLIMSSPADG